MRPGPAARRQVSRTVKRALTVALRVTGVSRVIRRRQYQTSIAIAMYHGVCRDRLAVDEWCFIDEATFTRQMEYLARHFDVVHVEDVATAAAAATTKPVAAITFDDGFESVHAIAWPVLKRLGIPATVYLVSDLVDTAETVWFARLHQSLATTSVASLEFDGVTYPLTSDEDRSTASQALQAALKRFAPDDFQQHFSQILGQLGVDVDAATVPQLRMLTSQQIREMGEGGLVRFGGHTASHQILTRVPSDRGGAEINTSVEAVERITGRATGSFAYPNGGRDDFDERSVEAVQRLGIPCAVTTEYGPNWPDSDPYRLRRYGIGSRDSINDFAWKMHHCADKLAFVRRPR